MNERLAIGQGEQEFYLVGVLLEPAPHVTLDGVLLHLLKDRLGVFSHIGIGRKWIFPLSGSNCRHHLTRIVAALMVGFGNLLCGVVWDLLEVLL